MVPKNGSNGSKHAPADERRRTILVVDDRPNALKAFMFLLDAHGFHVLAAPDVATGLALLDEWAIDAIVADLKLGDGPDGASLLEAAERWHSGVKSRYLLTSDPLGETLAEATGSTWIDRGADGWPERMVALLREATGSPDG
jgi:CheY-like chemotaxis protein